MKIRLDIFKVISILFLLVFLGIMVYFGVKEPPKEIIEEVKKTNPLVTERISQILRKESNHKKGVDKEPLVTMENEQDVKSMEGENTSTLKESSEKVESVSEIVEKNRRIKELISTYKDFQLNYLRYQQATSGGKFPEKGKFLKDAYEQSLEKLLSFNTEEDYKLLIDFALSREWRRPVKEYFFTKLAEVQNNIKDAIIIEKLANSTAEENMILLVKGLSIKLSPENREKILNVFTKIPPNFEKAKKEIENVINR